MLVFWIIILLLSIIVGFIITYFVNYKPYKSKKDARKLILYWSKNKYHIHHWITFSILIFFLLLGSFLPFSIVLVLIGLGIGANIISCFYKDWCKIKFNLLLINKCLKMIY